MAYYKLVILTLDYMHVAVTRDLPEVQIKVIFVSYTYILVLATRTPNLNIIKSSIYIT